jgi:hypothetical protein
MRKYAFKCPEGKLLMTQLSKRLVGIAAGTVLLSLVSTGAHAQTKFHNQFDTGVLQLQGFWFSQYTFQSSMILNSIGIYTNGQPLSETSYKINGGITGPREQIIPAAGLDSDGFQWLEFSGGLSVNAGTVLRVYTEGYKELTLDDFGQIITFIENPTELKYTKQPYNFSAQEISWDGSRNFFAGTLNQSYTNSNIRVTNPSANVAPEPGSFALALTGGAALLGICIRRRRNAA